MSSETGLFGSFRRLASNGIELLSTRIELFVLELQEEKFRLVEALIWASAGVFLAGMTLIIFSFLLVFLAWGNPQICLLILIALSLLYSGLAAWSFLRLRAILTKKPFHSTIESLKRDRACLNTQE